MSAFVIIVKPPTQVAFIDQGKLVVLGQGGVVELEDLPARIALTLNNKSSPMTGSQLAETLGVTGSAIVKASEKLIDLGIVRKESLPMSKNVKLYNLVLKILDEKSFAKLKEEVSPTMLKILINRFGGNEKLTTIFIHELTDYLRAFSNEDRIAVTKKIMEELTGERISNEK